MKSTSAPATTGDIFQIHGLPLSLKSDSGPAIISDEFKEFSKTLDWNIVEALLGTHRGPQSNGLAEPCMKSLKERVQIAAATGCDGRSEH